MAETFFEQFHFLRPAWLAIIPFALWLHFHLRRRFNASEQWKAVIEPHLLTHLMVAEAGGRQVRPYQLLTAVFVLGAVALAGPAWERQVTPFTRDQAPLVILLKLTPTMLGSDQQPTRLDRAKHKISDLLDRRSGARTALIAYAGSAHTVLPLTDDAALINLYLDSLAPGLMPREGDDPAKALALAQQMLGASTDIGTVLLMTDGIDRTHADAFRGFAEQTGQQVLFWVFGTETGGAVDTAAAAGQSFGLVDGKAPPIDVAGLNAVAGAVGASVIRATPDQRDVDTMSREIRQRLVDTLQQDENLQWRDFGYVLAWPLALLILMWSRRGWTVRWQ